MAQRRIQRHGRSEHACAVVRLQVAGAPRTGAPSIVPPDLAPGTFTSLIGANGAGKTTLLRLLLGLLSPSSGTVMLDGHALSTLTRRRIASRIAYVPQSHVPSFPSTASEIVAMGRTPAIGWGARLGETDRHAIDVALERVAMRGFPDRSYAELSGGERQAVLIARALVQDARILLLDEPTASLDLGQQTRLMRTLSELVSDGYTVFASLHHPELAQRWSHKTVVMRVGSILAQGATREALSSDTLSTIYGLPTHVAEAGGQHFIFV